MTKSGAYTLTFNGTNTYTGETKINAGNLTISSGSAISDSGVVTLGNATGAILHVAASETIGTLSGGGSNGGDISIAASQALTVNQTSTGTFAGVISGSGALTKNGSGTLILSAANTYTGTTTVNAGTLTVAASNALGTTGNITFGGGTLQYGGGITTDLSSRIKNSGSAILIDTNSNNVTFASAVDSTNSGGLTKNGTGTLTLSAANTFTGNATVNAGTLQAATANALGGTSQIIVNNGGSFLVTAENAVNDNAAINLAGGRMAVSGTFNETLGLLTLSANSTIDLAGFTGTLRFGGVGSWASDATLAIWNWKGLTEYGTQVGDGIANRNIVFTDATSPNDLTNYLSRISFYSDSGSSFVGNAFEKGFTGSGGGTEIIAVPEAETYLYALALLAGYAVFYLRRQRKNKTLEANSLHAQV